MHIVLIDVLIYSAAQLQECLINVYLLTYLLTQIVWLIEWWGGWWCHGQVTMNLVNHTPCSVSSKSVLSFGSLGVEICLFLVVVRNLLLREISNRERLKKHSIVTYFLLYLLHALSSYHGN